MVQLINENEITLIFIYDINKDLYHYKNLLGGCYLVSIGKIKNYKTKRIIFTKIVIKKSAFLKKKDQIKFQNIYIYLVNEKDFLLNLFKIKNDNMWFFDQFKNIHNNQNQIKPFISLVPKTFAPIIDLSTPAPVNDVPTPIKDSSTPAPVNDIPTLAQVKDSSTPIKELSTLVKEASAPVKDSSTQNKEASTPVNVSSTPIKEVSIPIKDSLTPIKEASNAVKEASTPIKDSSTPVNVSSTPIKDASTPVKDASAPVKDSLAPNKEASTPIKYSSTPIKEASTPVNVSSTPVKDSSTPVKEASIPIKDSSTPNKEASTPVNVSSTPIKEASPPTPIKDVPTPTPIKDLSTPAPINVASKLSPIKEESTPTYQIPIKPVPKQLFNDAPTPINVAYIKEALPTNQISISDTQILNNYINFEHPDPQKINKDFKRKTNNQNQKLVGDHWGGRKITLDQNKLICKIPNTDLLKKIGVFNEKGYCHFIKSVDKIPTNHNPGYKLLNNWVCINNYQNGTLDIIDSIPEQYDVGFVLINPVDPYDLRLYNGNMNITFQNLCKESELIKNFFVTDYFPYYNLEIENHIPKFEDHKNAIIEQVLRIINSCPKLLILGSKETQSTFYKVFTLLGIAFNDLSNIFGVPSCQILPSNTIIFTIHHPSVQKQIHTSNTKFIINITYTLLNKFSDKKTDDWLNHFYIKHIECINKHKVYKSNALNIKFGSLNINDEQQHQQHQQQHQQQIPDNTWIQMSPGGKGKKLHSMHCLRNCSSGGFGQPKQYKELSSTQKKLPLCDRFF